MRGVAIFAPSLSRYLQPRNKTMQETIMAPIRGYNQKFPDWIDEEIYAYNNKHLLKSNTKGYGGKTR
jgi:hypothetical protein